MNHYHREKNKKVIGIVKGELGRKIMTKFGAKTYSYLTDDNSEYKKQKAHTKK